MSTPPSLGYIHVILPPIAYDVVPVDTIAHEFTHALLQEYIIPTWLNEAIAMRMEDAMVGQDGLILTREMYQEHVDFWNEETIQEFWSDEIWGKSSEGFELSYVLARILWKKIVEDLSATKEELVKFIRTIDVTDSGNAAFKAIFDHSLGELVEDFLGEGNWEPNKHLMKVVEI